MLKRQISRFLVVGISTVLVDLICYSIALMLSVPLGMAKAIGFVCGTVFAYFANKQWTFTATGGVWIFARFAALYGCTLLLNISVNSLAFSVFSTCSWLTQFQRLPILLAFVVATGLSAVTNFIGMKYLVFRK